ncbi:MAG: YkgJ family cysteine cluster protein [Planctomycetaceae bacterium]|nr:YkgJ family cysteine cluster protein [Planctomycetaceae bacterium]
MNPVKRPDRKEIPEGKIPCEYCPGKCCRYFALPLDTPETEKEFSNIYWFMLHDKATVFVDDGTWYLLVHTKCRNLDDATNLCLDYESRPKICRSYSFKKCEYEDHYVYDQYFELPEQVAEYAAVVLRDKKKGKGKK